MARLAVAVDTTRDGNKRWPPGAYRADRRPEADARYLAPVLSSPIALRATSRARSEEEDTMLHYALVFLIVGLIAGALGLGGVAAVAGQISWVLFLVALVLIVVHMASGRRIHTP